MVARRPRGDEDVVGTPLEHVVDGGIGRSDRRDGGLPASGTGGGIGVDAHNAGFRNGGAHARDELGRMRMKDGRLVALRSLDAIERRKGLVLQHPRNGAQPVGALGVAGRGDVLKENRMRVEPCSHAPI